MDTWWGVCTALALLFVACDFAPAPTAIRRSGWSAALPPRWRPWCWLAPWERRLSALQRS